MLTRCGSGGMIVRPRRRAGRFVAEKTRRLARTLLPSSLYRLIRKRRVARQIENFTPRRVSHEYGGSPLTLLLADPLAEGWYDHEWPELPEVAFLRRGRLVPGARVFDLGAHQCVVALMLARIVGTNGSVVAVEAEPHNARIGSENSSLNEATNLTVLNAAASDRPGSLRFSESLNGRVEAAGGWGTVQVPAVTLDDLAVRFGAPDVLLVDVEGFESRVLDGGTATLHSARPDVFVEVHAACGLEQNGGSVEHVVASFPESNYELFAAPAREHFESYRFEPFDPAQGVPKERFFLIAIAR